MMKQWLIQTRQRLFDNFKNQQKTDPQGSDEPNYVRRRLFRQTTIGALSVTATAGLAKQVVDTLPGPDFKQKYHRDALQGEAQLRQREYVVMTSQEKEAMLQSLINNYNNKT